MFVIMRKFAEDKDWNICAVSSSEEGAKAQVIKEEKGGREAVFHAADYVWIAENGNHTWN